MAKLFQTGNGEITTLTNCRLGLTDNVWLKAALLKAISLMCDDENWQTQGDATIEFARDKSNEMYESILFDEPDAPMIPVGAIMLWHMDTPPDRWVICDGTGYLKTDYPALWALWGTKYGTSPLFFGSPDYRGRVPFGVDVTHDLDDTFGEASHTLTIGEMPSHTHRVPKQSATVNAAVNVTTPAARTDTTATPQIITDATGGGGSHNNIQPSMGAYFIAYGGELP